MNYLTKPPPPADEYYFEKDTYVVNNQTGVSNRMPNSFIERNGAKVKEINVKTMGNTTGWAIMFEVETTTATTAFTKLSTVTETIKVVPMFHLKIGKLLRGMVDVVCRLLKTCCTR